MKKKTKDYLKHLKDLDYPEYSHKPKITAELIKGYSKERNNHSVDLGLIDLSLNQNTRLNKGINEIIKKSIADISQYTHTQDDILIRQISKQNKIPAKNILITAGCDGALRILTRMFINKATKVCIPIPSFGRYEYHSKINQGSICFFENSTFPYEVRINELINFLKKNDIDVLLMANPNNPTGMFIPRKEIETLTRKFNGVIILDEALLLNSKQSSIKLLKENSNLIITRSFSKIYGLAGLRIGYILGHPDQIKIAAKLTSPFEVSSIAIKLASFVLNDKDFYDECRKEILESIKELKKSGDKLKNIRISPTQTATALLKFEKRDSLYYSLLRQKIKTISCKDFRGIENENCVRIAIKDIASTRKLVEALQTL